MVRVKLAAQLLWTLVSFCLLVGCSNVDGNADASGEVIESPRWPVLEGAWRSLVVGKSTAAQAGRVFNATVDEKDRYAFAQQKEEGSEDSLLMMVDLDEDSIVTAKYYWEWISTTPSPFVRLDSWEMAMDTHIPASVLQEYTAGAGPREEAILEYFGQRLYEIAAHFEHLEQVFGATGSMKRIYTLAVLQYNMRSDKQALLSEQGFTFDGELFGGKCTMSLTPVDEQAGWYFVVLKGHRTRNFFSGW